MKEFLDFLYDLLQEHGIDPLYLGTAFALIFLTTYRKEIRDWDTLAPRRKVFVITQFIGCFILLVGCAIKLVGGYK